MPKQAQIGQEISLLEAIDSKAPGHYARVFGCMIDSDPNPVAIKIMRSEHFRIAQSDLSNLWYVETFITEAKMLATLESAGASSITRLIGCGYIDSFTQPVHELYTPGQDNHAHATNKIIKGLRGSQVIIYSPKEVGDFATELDSAYFARRIPFLLLEKRNEKSFFESALETFNHGRGLHYPVVEVIDIIYQAARLLETAHSCGIVYKDFKLAHYYWDGLHLHFIDWNASAFITPDMTSSQGNEVRVRDIHAFICSLVPLFTSRPFMSNSFYADPSPPYRVQTRYQNPQPVQWEVSDTHIGNQLQEWVNRGIRDEYANVSDLVTELRAIESVEWGTLSGNDELSIARAFLQQAVSNIRKAQASMPRSSDEAIYYYRESERNLIEALDVGAYKPNTGPYLECQRLFTGVAHVLASNQPSAILP